MMEPESIDISGNTLERLLLLEDLLLRYATGSTVVGDDYVALRALPESLNLT
jgi:hypothetical protein